MLPESGAVHEFVDGNAEGALMLVAKLEDIFDLFIMPAISEGFRHPTEAARCTDAIRGAQQRPIRLAEALVVIRNKCGRNTKPARCNSQLDNALHHRKPSLVGPSLVGADPRDELVHVKEIELVLSEKAPPER